MPVSVKVEPLERDIDLLIRQDLAPAARSRILASFARETLLESEEKNAAALGRVPPHETFVDGRHGASEDGVLPDGMIVYQFNLLEDLFAWIGEQLVIHAPRRSGLFAESFVFFAGGVRVDPAVPAPPAEDYVFLNTQPYARKIERGESPQAPDGVFQAVAALAARRFGNVAKIVFTYQAPLGGGTALEKWAATTTQRRGGQASKVSHWNRRQPAIVIYPR